jgi:DNA polymerase III alpha subunit
MPRLQPARIEDVAAALTMDCRSAECEDLMDQYLGRTANPGFPGSDDPAIVGTLGETRGLILYQEQIMLLLNRFGGIAPADGYEFVKAASKRKAAVVAEYRAKFLSGAAGQEIEPQFAGRLFQQLADAAVYALCKATCLATAMTIYRAAYLKAHYRRAFDTVLGTVLARA